MKLNEREANEKLSKANEKLNEREAGFAEPSETLAAEMSINCIAHEASGDLPSLITRMSTPLLKP